MVFAYSLFFRKNFIVKKIFINYFFYFEMLLLSVLKLLFERLTVVVNLLLKPRQRLSNISPSFLHRQSFLFYFFILSQHSELIFSNFFLNLCSFHSPTLSTLQNLTFFSATKNIKVTEKHKNGYI
jgi:hypothetical protein